jgi:hypothetical protein
MSFRQRGFERLQIDLSRSEPLIDWTITLWSEFRTKLLHDDACYCEPVASYRIDGQFRAADSSARHDKSLQKSPRFTSHASLKQPTAIHSLYASMVRRMIGFETNIGKRANKQELFGSNV